MKTQIKMKAITGITIFILCFTIITGSKLNVPRVLLPLFNDFAANFTLEVTDGGCYTWSTLRPNLIRLQCLDVDPEKGCCSKTAISSTIKDLRRNTETILAEDFHSGLILRCEVILDVISSLSIVTTTREIFLDESPEAFEVRAYDDQGNEFSTLEGVEFEWSFRTVGAANRSGESTVVRYMTFAESPYETPRSIETMERLGLKGHIILLEGRQTGAATVTVRLPQHEYAEVATAGVQLLVLTNLIVSPPDATLLLGDNLKYRLHQFQHGRMTEISFPSAQYHLTSENKIVEVDAELGVATGLELGKARLVLVDGNVGSASDVKPPTASLSVAPPHDLSLAVLPHRKWTVVVGHSYDIVAELHDANHRLFHLGTAAALEIHLDEQYFHVKARPLNGSFVHGMPIKTGKTEVVGHLLGVKNKNGGIKSLGSLSAAAELHIYDPVRVTPSAVLVPWDPVARARYEIPLTATGGDGLYTWSSARSSVAAVTHRGIVKTLEQGTTTVTAAMTANRNILGLSVVRVLPPSSLQILDTSLEAEVGVPILVHLVVYGEVDGKQVPFTRCDALPFTVNLSDDSFSHTLANISNHKLETPACAAIAVVGKSPGAAQIIIKYGDLAATAIVAAHNPLTAVNPSSGTTLLTVGTSRLILFSGGPRSWTLKPSEHSHMLQNADVDGENLVVNEITARGPLQPKHSYAYEVTCRQLSETVLTLHVTNKVVGSKRNPEFATASVRVVCGKPKYLSLRPLQATITRCPLKAEEMVALTDQPIDVEVIVKDLNGRRFDNVTSLDFTWTISKPILRPEFKNVKSVTIEQEGFTFPSTHYQRLTPSGRASSLEVQAQIVGYNQEALFSQSISPESPPFPEISSDGNLRTPQIQESLTVRLVDVSKVSPGVIELFAGENAPREVRVSHGSGYFEVSPANGGVVEIEKDARILKLKALGVGTTVLTISDLCLDAEPSLLTVQVYRIGSVSLDVAEYIERGKSEKARVLLYDEEGSLLTSVPDAAVLKLKPIAGSDLISVGSDPSPVAGEASFIVRGLSLGLSSLSVVVGEVSSLPTPIQVFSPLRVHPKNLTLLVGSSRQVSAFDGPPGAHIEWTVDEPNVARVTGDGVLGGTKIGSTTLIARATTLRRQSGQKIVSSEARLEIQVVPLKGVSIHAPIARLVVGGVMPLRAVGSAETSSLLRLWTSPPLRFTWSLSQDSCAEIQHTLHKTGVMVADTDLSTVQLHGLKPGRVTVSLTVYVPAAIAGSFHPVEYTDTLSIQILSDLGLNSPRAMRLDHLLVSPQASTELRATRDIRRYQVTVLRGGPDVVRVSQDGVLTSGDSAGSAVVTFGPVEKPWRHLVVHVKPVEYILINAVPSWKLQNPDKISALPNGLDLDLIVSFHDEEGNKFDAVRSNIMVESDQKSLTGITRGADNGSLTLNLIDSGTTTIRVWDEKVPHQPFDYLQIRSNDILFPSQGRVTLGDVICLRMPLVSNDETIPQWSVDNPAKLRLWPEYGLAVACESHGVATIAHRASPRLRSRIEVLPLKQISFLPQEVVLSTVPESVSVYSLVLSSDHDTDSISNLKAYNGSCDGNVPRDFAPSCYPYTCQIHFNSPAAPVDVDSLFHVSPGFDIETGTYSCRITCIAKPSPTTATLTEMVVLNAVSLEGTIQSQTLLLPVYPAVYLHQTELKVSYEKPRALFTISGVAEIFNQIKVVTDKQLVSVSLSTETESSRTFSVKVHPSWWTLDEPPALSVVLWSPKTQQKLQLHIRCVGHRMASDEPFSLWPWFTAIAGLLFIGIVSVACLRTVPKGSIQTNEQAYVRTSPTLDHSHLSHNYLNTSRNSNEYSPRRPLDEYPIYGSPWRRRAD